MADFLFPHAQNVYGNQTYDNKLKTQVLKTYDNSPNSRNALDFEPPVSLELRHAKAKKQHIDWLLIYLFLLGEKLLDLSTKCQS